MPKIWWDDHTSAITRRSTMWAASDRGWLFRDGDRQALGHYLDYGEGYYRSPHKYCAPGACKCTESQPGFVHAVSVVARESHWFPTVAEAKRWIEEKAEVTAPPSRLDKWREKRALHSQPNL